MARLRALWLALAAAAAPRALAQEDSPKPEEVPAPAAAGAVADVDIQPEGIRARLVLKRGSAIEGLLPLGTSYWEKASPGCDYEEADASDPAAGLRLYFVLGMEGSVFFRKSDIAGVKDLGALTDEAAAAIRRNLIDARRKALEEREAALKESLLKILGPEKAPEPAAAKPVPVEAAPAPEATPSPAVTQAPSASFSSKEEEAKAKAEARRIRGEELLQKFPPPDWSIKRFEMIQWRDRVAKVPPDDLETIFLRENDVWLEALRRREAAESKTAPAETAPPAPR